MILRRPHAGEEAALVALMARCNDRYAEWAPEGWTPPPGLAEHDEARLRERLADAAVWTRVAVRGDDVAGFVMRRAAHVHSLFVDPPAWRHGVGSALLAAAAGAARAEGHREADLWAVEASAGTRAFYERNGWRQAPERRFHEALGLALVRYRLAL